MKDEGEGMIFNFILPTSSFISLPSIPYPRGVKPYAY